MAETKHTPGPWRIDHETNMPRIIGPNREHRQNHSRDYIGVPMISFDVVGYVGCPDYEKQEANANLMAAAPDLLKACEAVMKLKEEPAHVVGQILTCDLVEQIEAAIAKAKGEPCN